MKRILVIDDDPPVARMIEVALEMARSHFITT